ncbi:MAG: phage tail protein [Phascolarctobacterium sp.]|nr:phage tail protein [Phascolarctobacterium sp.]
MANSKNKVKFGLKNVHYAKATFDEDGNVTYDTPVRIPGAVNLSLDPEGENEPWYADNIVYVVLNNNSGYSGDLEIALIPDSFYTDILHEELDSNGVMAENTEVEVEHFGLLFQFEGDKHGTRHVLYNCTCSRPAMESATTEDSKEPQTDTLSLTASALANGYVKAKTCESTSSDVYDSWFDAVYEPQSAATETTSEDTDTEEADG